MRYGLIVFAVTVLCAGMLVSAAYAGTGGGPASLKAAMETQSPAETIGCRANGQQMPDRKPGGMQGRPLHLPSLPVLGRLLVNSRSPRPKFRRPFRARIEDFRVGLSAEAVACPNDPYVPWEVTTRIAELPKRIALGRGMTGR